MAKGNNRPLFEAVAQNDVAHLYSLLQEGTSVNVRDQGYTLLHFAIMTEKRNVFDYLLTVDDILLDEENSRHSTPLMEAVRLQNEYYALELLKKNVDINHEHSRFKITPLHMAAEANNEKIVEALIEKGADINCQDFGGDTPLHKACKDNSSVIHQLLYHGADTTIENFYGQRAFDVSVLHCSPEIQEILYNYTFDGTMSIRTVTIAMVRQVPILFKLIEENDIVSYNEDDLKYLSYNLHKIPFQTLKIFMKKHYDVMESLFERYDLLSEVPSEQTQCFFYRDLARRPSNSGPMMKKMISCEDISEEDMTQMVCYALSYGNSIRAYDLYLIFDKFGYGELFSILLHMDTIPLSGKLLLVDNPRLILPAFIHNFRFSLLLLHAVDRGGDVTFFKNLKRFTRNRTIVAFERLLHLGENASVALGPSLLELARDGSRQHLIQTFEIKKNSDFFTMLKSLPVNQVYKDILSYKKPIYL